MTPIQGSQKQPITGGSDSTGNKRMMQLENLEWQKYWLWWHLGAPYNLQGFLENTGIVIESWKKVRQGLHISRAECRAIFS